MTMPAFPAFDPKNATSNRRHKASRDMILRLAASLPADFTSDEPFAQLPPSVSPTMVDVEGYTPNVVDGAIALPPPPAVSALAPTQATAPPVLSNVDRFTQGHSYPTRKPITANPALFPFQAPPVPDALPDVPIRDTREEAKRALLGSGIAAALTALTGGNAGDAFAAYAGGAGQANEGLARQRQFNYENLVRSVQGQNDRAQGIVTRANAQQEQRLDDALALDRLNEQGYQQDADSYDKQLGYAERADVADEQRQSKERASFVSTFSTKQERISSFAPKDQVAAIKGLNADAKRLGLEEYVQPVPGEASGQYREMPYSDPSAAGVEPGTMKRYAIPNPPLVPTAKTKLAGARSEYLGALTGTVEPKLQDLQKRTEAYTAGVKSQNEYRAEQSRQGRDKIELMGAKLDLDRVNAEAKNTIAYANLAEYQKRTKAYTDSFNYYGLGGQGKLGKQAISLAERRHRMSTELNRLVQLKSALVNGKNGNELKQRERDERLYPELKAARQQAIADKDEEIRQAREIIGAIPDVLPKVPAPPALKAPAQSGRSNLSDMPPLDNVPSADYVPTVNYKPNGSGFSMQSIKNGTAPAPAPRSSLPAVPRNAPPPTQHHSVSQRRTATGQFDGPPAKANTSKMSNAEFGRYLAQRLAAKFGTKK